MKEFYKLTLEMFRKNVPYSIHKSLGVSMYDLDINCRMRLEQNIYTNIYNTINEKLK